MFHSCTARHSYISLETEQATGAAAQPAQLSISVSPRYCYSSTCEQASSYSFLRLRSMIVGVTMVIYSSIDRNVEPCSSYRIIEPLKLIFSQRMTLAIAHRARIRYSNHLRSTHDPANKNVSISLTHGVQIKQLLQRITTSWLTTSTFSNPAFLENNKDLHIFYHC